MLIKGIHHVSMKCFKGEEYERVIEFYTKTLGMRLVRTWDEGAMLDTGNGKIELFTNATEKAETGVIRHFALKTDSVDACVAAVREAGYTVFVEPKDIGAARIAFCFGPLGEQIEFFEEKA